VVIPPAPPPMAATLLPSMASMSKSSSSSIIFDGFWRILLLEISVTGVKKYGMPLDSSLEFSGFLSKTAGCSARLADSTDIRDRERIF
jgi:hypothetical protein